MRNIWGKVEREKLRSVVKRGEEKRREERGKEERGERREDTGSLLEWKKGEVSEWMENET